MSEEAKSEMKECPHCAEDIKAEAIRCKHCGEFVDGRKKASSSTEDGRFDRYEDFLRQSYPDYQVVSKNYKENFLILNRQTSNFSCLICALLLCLAVVPGLIYAIVAGSNKRTVSVTIYFDENNKPSNTSNDKYFFLVSGFLKANR